jgi:transketolase
MNSQLAEISRKIRCDAILSIYAAQSGHPGGVLSCIDLLTVLFHRVMTPAIERLGSYSDDYFILSKGHAVPALYATAVSTGLLRQDELKTLRKIDSRLQGHPDVTTLPWLEVSTGSLGQGISFAAGLAKAQKLTCDERTTYVLLGDGEMQEGQVWEAAMFASHHQLNNLIAIADYNKLQSDAKNSEICTIEPLVDKWVSFGWRVLQSDGHDLENIEEMLLTAKNNRDSKPTIIIAHTTKGKGVSFMENQPLWHGSVALSRQQFVDCLAALGCDQNCIEGYLNG